MSKLNVALIGQGFMGRTHSNAWGQVAKFFKPPLQAGDAHRFRAAGGESAGLRRQLGLAERLDRLAAARPLAGDRPGRRRHAELHARPGGQGGHRRRQARLLREAHRRHAGRRPRDGRGRARRPRSRRSSGSTTAACPAVGAGPSAGQGGQARRRFATSGRPTCRTGPTRACRCSGGSTRSWPAPAPTAT